MSITQTLQGLLPASSIAVDPETIALYSQDVFGRGCPLAAVVRPSSVEEIQALVKSCGEQGVAIITRGGGMSYTAGYLATEQNSVLIDMAQMNKIVELNIEDGFVTVEAGVTWSQLHETLKPHNLRTPFWGTLSGSCATVGGGLSQNGVFWGSGYNGSAGDSLLSLAVVTADGELLHTGAASQKAGTPFMRHFGPDLTGLFVGDCGALGVKVTATLPLVPMAGARAYTSHAFSDAAAMMSAMAEVSRQALASECFGFDPYLQQQRMKRASLSADVVQLSGVMKGRSSFLAKIISGVKIAFAGRRFMDEVKWSFSTISEGRTQTEADFQAQVIRSICQQHDGNVLADSIPRLLSANPFGPVNNMVGAEGERWLPIHALVPHSKAHQTIALIEKTYARHQDSMATYAIKTGFLIATVSQQITLIEPVFFWPDALDKLHEHSLEPEHLKRLNRFEAVPGAWDAVNAIKTELADVFMALGATHYQLGKAYRYYEGLKPEALATMLQLKAVFDPDGILNPNVLGLGSSNVELDNA